MKEKKPQGMMEHAYNVSANEAGVDGPLDCARFRVKLQNNETQSKMNEIDSVCSIPKVVF